MFRPPIVTILGHVDHGKTSLLDYIRKSRIAAKEHGGITQRIGAYEISTGIKGYASDKITFIDTPGHEAFSELRARGAHVADIAILIIDAKDSLKPQTVESIQHIKNAKIPFIVALNKTDLPDANVEKVKRDLLKYEVITEDKGGTTVALPISAKTGKGIDELLESILLITSDIQPEFDPEKPPFAYIIETKKDKRGIVVSAIIKEGTMRLGDTVYAEDKKIKVRSMLSDLGVQMKEVQPSTPFELLGFEDMPQVGAAITATEQASTKEVKEEKAFDASDIRAQLGMPTKIEEKKLALIVKADAQGSLDAIVQALSKNEHIDIVLSAVGDIHRSDIFLAKTTKSIVIGFSTKVDPEVDQLSKQEKVIIKTYNIIYELLEELEEVSDLMQEKAQTERNLKGEGKILATFIIEGEKAFGAKITKGKFNLGDNVEIHRNGDVFANTKLVSLRLRAKPVQEIKKDQECGMVFSPALDMKVGDVIKSIL